MNDSTPQLTRVGTILAYGGSREALTNSGWFVCDGRALNREVFAELFAAIGTNFGAPRPREQEFNIPDLRGLFLRGLSPAGLKPDRDPDGDLRKSLLPGGSSGRNVGALQTYGSAPPKNPFTAEIRNVGNTEAWVDNIGGFLIAKQRAEATNVETNGAGGDVETRPINKYVYFIVKYRTKHDDGSYVTLPIGSIIPYAGSDAATIGPRWRLCNGEVVPASAAPDLAKILGKAHGGSTEGVVLPDLRGYFLRGVSEQSLRDPEAAKRTAPRPDLGEGDRGFGGDAVGSEQKSTTGYPVKGPFKTSVPRLPTEWLHCLEGGVKYLYLYTESPTLAALTRAGGGGDRESRPWNMNVSWCIRVN